MSVEVDLTGAQRLSTVWLISLGGIALLFWVDLAEKFSFLQVTITKWLKTFQAKKVSFASKTSRYYFN